MPSENENKTTLSVAIPTYNGAKYIREALNSIISQLDEIDEEVEIVISDNASTDRTPEIIKEHQKKYSFIKYFRNERNLGPDKNFDLAVRRSMSEFVWLFSDDDQLRPGAIKKVLEVLKNYPELAAIFVNWCTYSCDSGQHDFPPILKFQKDILFETADGFLSEIRTNAAFVSSDIVRRSLWEKARPEDYAGTNWVQYATLLTLIVGHHSYCIAEPYVKRIDRGVYTLSEYSTERCMNNAITLMGILNGLEKKGYGKAAVDKVKGALLHHLPMEIIVYKQDNLPLKKSRIKQMVSQFKFYPSFWLIHLPLLIIPNAIHKIVYKIYKLEPINKVYRKMANKFSVHFH